MADDSNAIGMAPDTLKLIDQVHSLPAELFHDILELVLTPDSSSVRITKTYNPPAQLQLNRETRETFARTYYPNTTFVLEYATESDVYMDWIKSLLSSHISLITKIEVDRKELLATYKKDRGNAILSYSVGVCCLFRFRAIAKKYGGSWVGEEGTMLKTSYFTWNGSEEVREAWVALEEDSDGRGRVTRSFADAE